MELQKQHFGERPGSGRSLIKFVEERHIQFKCRELAIWSSRSDILETVLEVAVR